MKGGNSMEEILKNEKTDICILDCTNEQINELVEFAFRLNNNIENSSQFCPKSKNYIREEFLKAISNNSIFSYWKNNEVVGVLNYYMDELRNNADCTLLIDSQQCDYKSVANLLFKKVKNLTDINTKYTFFFPKENIKCANFLESINAKREVNEYGLVLEKNHTNSDRLNFNIGELPIDYYKEFKELHNEVFPDAYISGADIIENIGRKHFIYSIVENKTLIAYSVLRLNGNTSATAEIIAVREQFRRKGYGKAVISYLIDMAFNLFKVSKVDLIVDGDNEKAIKLYLNLGFVIEHENRCYIA